MPPEKYPDAAQEWLSKGFTMEAEVAWLENPMKKEGKIRLCPQSGEIPYRAAPRGGELVGWAV